MVVDSIVEDTTPTSSQEASAAFHDGCSDSKEIDSKPSGADGRFHKVLSRSKCVQCRKAIAAFFSVANTSSSQKSALETGV